jgi:hypothetical protein
MSRLEYVDHEDVTGNLCKECRYDRHITCAGAGCCECDLCVPYDLRWLSAQMRAKLEAEQAIEGLAMAHFGLTQEGAWQFGHNFPVPGQLGGIGE